MVSAKILNITSMEFEFASVDLTLNAGPVYMHLTGIRYLGWGR